MNLTLILNIILNKYFKRYVKNILNRIQREVIQNDINLRVLLKFTHCSHSHNFSKFIHNYLILHLKYHSISLQIMINKIL